MESSNVSILTKLPKPVNFERHIILDYSLEMVWKWINPAIFFNKLLGFKRNFAVSLEKRESQSIQLFNEVESVKTYVKNANANLMTPKVIYQFYKCKKEQEDIIILPTQKSSKRSTTEFSQKMNFPRQSKSPFLSLSDYVHPEGDTLALFVVTCGENVNDHALNLKEEGQYKKSFILQALALASAEALGEMVHKDIREKWGILDDFDLSIKDTIKGKYRGKRYSFGYPACPNLEDQLVIWELLQPQKIGIELTDGFMMDPEASMSAIVFHHPEAKYFRTK